MMIAAMMVAVLSANAQEAGQMFVKPMVGATMSKFTGDAGESTKFRLGFVGGAEFGYHVSNQFAATAGLLVAMQGANTKDTDHLKDISTTLTYLNIPMLANFYIAPGLAIKAGIQPGFLLSLKGKGSAKINGQWVDQESSSTDGTEKFDLSIPMGLSYEFSDFVIDARYNLGLTNVNKASDAKAKNAVIMLTLGYKINL